MSRSLFYLAIYRYRCWILAFIDSNQEIEKELRGEVLNAIIEVSEYNSSKTCYQRFTQISCWSHQIYNFAQLQKEFHSQLSKRWRFSRNFIKLIDLLLLFKRTSQDQLWELHLQSLHALRPYVFALEMINYTGMAPVYLSQMYVLKEKDPQTLEFLSNGGFSVSKLKVPFSSIG